MAPQADIPSDANPGRRRPFARTAAVIAIALAPTAACDCGRRDGFTPSDATAPSASMWASPDGGPPVALYGGDSNDPYDALHHAIYGSPKAAGWARCLVDGRGCLDEPALIGAGSGEPQRRPEIWIGGRPPTLTPDDAKHISARAPSIEKTAKDIARIDPTSRPVAAVWLQQAVWAAFDAIAAASPPNAHLLDVLAEAMQRLALPRVTLVKLAPSFSEVLAAHPEVFGHHGESDFTELVAIEAEPPGSTPKLLTTHARQRGSRSIFRRFVHVPASGPGVGELTKGSPSSVKLPPGSLAVLAESPLALAREGELVALPLVTLVETRAVSALAPNVTIRAAPFDVLEGHPRARTDSVTDSLPLTRLAPDAPFPQQGSCGGGGGDVVPMRRSCLLCHGPTGDTVRSFAHGDAAFRLAATPHEPTKAIVADKASRADFSELKRRLAPATP